MLDGKRKWQVKHWGHANQFRGEHLAMRVLSAGAMTDDKQTNVPSSFLVRTSDERTTATSFARSGWEVGASLSTMLSDRYRGSTEIYDKAGWGRWQFMPTSKNPRRRASTQPGHQKASLPMVSLVVFVEVKSRVTTGVADTSP